jgi:hypothetical protein
MEGSVGRRGSVDRRQLHFAATHQSPTADTAYCIFNEEVFGQRAGRATHVIAGGKAHDVGAGRDDLAGRFVAERHAALPRRQPAQGDV